MGEFFKFLGDVLEKGGTVAMLFTFVIITFGIVIRVLWSRNQELHKAATEHEKTLKNLTKGHSNQLQKLQTAHIERLEEMAQRHAEDLKTLSERHIKEKRLMGGRLDELQERRVEEARTVTEKVMAYIQHIDQFVAKLEVTIDILMSAARR